ncbi:TBC-domain-containing protein [Rhodotorula sp. JG-1b]|nr:TBC-domain-containing protein [Rhodotorula sp. JG-1b]
MPPRMRGHPLSPPAEDPSSNPNPATQPHAELYERTSDAQDPLFPNSPPLESQGAELQRTISQLARVEADSEAAASPHGNDSLASQRSLQIATTSAQRTSTPSSVRSRAASPLASPTAPSAYTAFADPFSSIVPARLSFPSPPHRLPDETISSIPLSHLVALVKALSRDLDEAQASLRSQRAELAALEKLVRDKGASEGEVERVKVRARTGTEEVGGDSAGGGKRDWSIDLPPAEEEALPPPKTETESVVQQVDLDIDDLTEAISSNAFDLGLTPVVPPPPLAALADDPEGSFFRSRALSLPDGSGAPAAAAAGGEIASSGSSAPAPVMNPTLPTTIGTKSNRPRHASLSARFVGYIAGAPPPSSSPTPSGSSVVVSPRKSQDATADDPSSHTGAKSQKRPRSGSMRSVNSVASSVTSGGERKSYGESSWLGGWRWGKSSSSHATGTGAASSSLKEASGAETEGEEEEGGANEVVEGDAALEPTRSRSRSRSSSTGSTSSPAESGGRSSSRHSSRRTSHTARSTVDTTLPGSPPPLKSPAGTGGTSSSFAVVEDRAPLLSPPESPTLTRRRSSAVPPNCFQPSVQQSTAAAVLSTPLTASTISLPSASPNRLTGYGSSGPTSPARSPTSNPLALPEVLELPGGPPSEAAPPPSSDASSDARLRFVPGVPLYSALAADAASSRGGSSAPTDRLVASAKGTINRALGLLPHAQPPGISRTSSHSSQSTSSAADAALNGLLHHLPSKLPPLSLARYSPFSQPALSMPATHVSLSASTASLTSATSAGPAGSPLIAHTAVLAPASAASGAQTMELDTISAEAAPPSLALLKPSYQSAAAAGGVGAAAIDEDDDGPMIDRFGFIYDVHTGMALLKESRRRKAGEHLAAAVDAREAEEGGPAAVVVAAGEEERSNTKKLEVSGVPAVMTTPQTELEVHPQLDALREAIGLTPTVEAENALSPPTSPSQLPPDPETPSGAVSNPADRPVKLVRAPSSSEGTSRRASPIPNGTGPQSMRALLVQLRTMTDALEQSQQAAWDAFIRRRQRKLAKLKQAQLEDYHQHYEDKAPTGRDRERDHHHRLQSVFQADEVDPDSIEQDVWTSENLVGVAQMGTEKKGKKEDWNEFKELVRKGIPIAYRPKIWGECSSANEAREPGVYQELLAQPTTEAEAPCLKQIDMDCHRTFPTNVFFAGNGPGVAKLRNVLVAYSRRDPKVGYCQGMNNLVATLLLTHPAEEDAFWVLVCIIENILPSDYYTSHLLVSRADQQVLKDLVDRTLPKLSAHLEEQGVELSAITFGWFLSLFTDCLPIQVQPCPRMRSRVWDLFFIHGTIFLFRIALAILKLHEPELLECDSAAGLYAMLGQLPAGLWNADRLLKVACDDLASAVKDRVVASLRSKHVAALEAEMGIGGGDDDSLA